ncbi:MAG TPA: 50S ribosomal protein L20 [Verrucomicrobiae bacterium]|nr:50S ribosomal protein L20 [Verrucomicrobiae bacterium]
MPRATNAPASWRRRKRMLQASKGYRGWRSKKFRYAKNAVWHGLTYSFAHRKDKKADYRALWNQRINAACRAQGVTYSRFIAALKKANIALDRKTLADLAVNDSKAFDAVLAATK